MKRNGTALQNKMKLETKHCPIEMSKQKSKRNNVISHREPEESGNPSAMSEIRASAKQPTSRDKRSGWQMDASISCRRKSPTSTTHCFILAAVVSILPTLGLPSPACTYFMITDPISAVITVLSSLGKILPSAHRTSLT